MQSQLDKAEARGVDLQAPAAREVGWETGRDSEPAFMDMNLHAVRGNSTPKVVRPGPLLPARPAG